MCPGETGSLSSPERAWLKVNFPWQRFDWLFLPRGWLGPLFRLVGLWMLVIGPEMCIRSGFWGSYCVPAWGFGLTFLEFPQTSLWFDTIIWISYFATGIWLLAGGRGAAPVALAVVTIVFYGSREQWVSSSHYGVMVFTYMVAYLFDRPGLNCSRRIIQVSVCSCYFFAAVNKLHPEFLTGATFNEIINHGWTVRDCMVPFVQSFGLQQPWLAALAQATVALELFLAFGLWFGKTRKLAIVVGLVFHGLIQVFIGSGIEVFSPVMWTGYLAFLDRKGDAPEPRPPAIAAQRRGETLCALLVIVILIAMPSRFFIWHGGAFNDLAGFEKQPWGFAMYTVHEVGESSLARYRTASGSWVEVPLAGRMKHLSANIELLSLAKHILRTHSEAVEAQVESRLVTNRHWFQTKRLTCIREGNDFRATVDASHDRRPFRWD